MKRLCWIGLAGLTAALAVAAEERFSSAVRAADFAAAGLAKLSPEEIARLDALVRDYKSGALAAAQREAAVAAEARVAAEAKAARAEAAAQAQAEKAQREKAEAEQAAEKKKSEPGLLTKAKVLLTPGTQVEYAAVESRIAGEFRGWESKTVLKLEDGSRWRIANSGSYYTPVIASPKVKVVPSSFGGYWMTIEGVKERVKVVPFGVAN